MRTLIAIFLCIGITIVGTNSSKGQTIELLAGNTLNGAVNGTILGGATMALNNDTDFGPLRVGVGLGTLYGLGTGGYDVVSSGGQQLIVSGLFNDGNNTSIIVLLDTFYGAAGGAIIASSVMLIAEKPLVEGLQYGSAVGAWIGFGVGVIDAFAFAERQTPTSGAVSYNNSEHTANGLIGLQFDGQTSLGFISPGITQTFKASSTSGISAKLTPSVEILNLNINF